MGEACDTGGKSTAHIGVDESHFRCLVVIFIMHILDGVQGIHIEACQPVHHPVILADDLVVLQVLSLVRRVLRSYLLAALRVAAAVQGVKQTLGQVRAGPEELHFLTGLCCGYAAADGVVVAPYRPHHVVILILDGAGPHRDSRRVFLKGLRQAGGIKDGQVRLRARSHIFQGMQETVVALGHHGATIHAHACHLQGRPYRVAGEQLIVGRNSGELHHSALHDKMVYQLLCLCLSQGAICQITLQIDVQESGYTAYTHSCSVLGADGCQIAEVQPLYSLSCVDSRLRNIEAVGRRHHFHLFQGTNLLCQLFPLTDNLIEHGSVTAVGEVFFLLCNQEVNTIERHSTIITYDTAAAIGIRKSCDNLIMTGFLHLRCVYIEYRLVVRLMIFGKNLMKLFRRLIPVSCAGLLRHLDTAIGHERAFQRLVRLKSYDLFQLLLFFYNICRRVGCNTGYYLCLHIEDAALGALLLLKLLQLAPELFGGICRPLQKRLIALIGCIVVLNEVSYIHVFFPVSSTEAIPCCLFCHVFPPCITNSFCYSSPISFL